MFSNINSTPTQQTSFSTFNQSLNKNSPFAVGGGQTPQPNNSIFQSPSTPNFGAQPVTPTFQNTPVTKSLFGNTQSFQPSTSNTGGLFSTGSQASAFGSNTIGTPGFGSTSQAGGFGSTSQAGGFGSISQPGGFGSTSQPGGFGSTSQTGGFGSTSQTGGFGSAPQTGGFGSTSQTGGFGSISQTGGFGSTSQGGFGTNFQSQPQPVSSSVILLGPNPNSGFTSTAPTMGASTSQTTGFGSFGGTSTGFGTQATQSGFGGFGSGSTGFGSSSMTTQTGFGGQIQSSQPGPSLGGFGSQAGQSMFGAQTTQTGAFGSLSQPIKTGFQTTSTLFGSTPTSQTGFGSSLGTQQPQSGFGSTAFGSGTQPATSFGKTGFSGFQGTSTSTGTGLGSNIQQGTGFGTGFGQTSSLGAPGQTFQTSTSQPFRLTQPTQTGFSSQGFGSQATTNQGFGTQTSLSQGFGSGFNTSSLSTTSQSSLPFPSFSQTQSGSNFFQNRPGNLTSLSQPSVTQSSFGFTSQPSSIFGGGIQAQTGLSTGTSLATQPTSSLIGSGPTTGNLMAAINSESDKSIEIFGYRAPGTRFGAPEYYNSNFSTLPDQNNVTEAGLAMVSNTTPQEVSNFANLTYEHDLKLGTLRNANNDFELRDVPSDTITKLRFSRQQQDLLACSSWDGSVSVFKVDDRNQALGSKVFVNGCVLDIDWVYGSSNLVLAASNGLLYHYDINTNSYVEFAKHNGPVKTVKSCGEFYNNMVISGSYDGTVKLWDLRSKVCSATISAYSKVYDLDVCRSGLSFITSERDVFVYQYNDTSRSIMRKKVEISTFPTRCLAMTTFNCRKEGGFVCAVGTCGGKVGVFPQSNNAREFSFKVNRVNNPSRMNSQLAYPVHDIEFHPRTYVLALGGGDGSVSFWDIQNHSNVLNLKAACLPVTSIAFDSSGRLLAYAIGYDWSRGIRGFKFQNMAPAIFIRQCNEELKHPCPKPVHSY